MPDQNRICAMANFSAENPLFSPSHPITLEPVPEGQVLVSEQVEG